MAVIRVQVSTSITDREADYNKTIAETAALLRSKGLRNIVRVTHSRSARYRGVEYHVVRGLEGIRRKD